MREPEDIQFKIGQVPIKEISVYAKDRDDRPAVLSGLQQFYVNDDSRQKIFDILERHLSTKVDLNRGRPGMPLWRIFVLGVVKQALDCDFDRVRNLADDHRLLRQMLGHADFADMAPYKLQTIIDNVSLLTEDILEEINAVVVAYGHTTLVMHTADTPLRGRVDWPRRMCIGPRT